MLITICDDTWNVLNMQHITLNLKRLDLFQASLRVALKKINSPAHMAESQATTLEKKKDPNPNPQTEFETWYM